MAGNGDLERGVMVRFGKEGPRGIQVGSRKAVLENKRDQETLGTLHVWYRGHI